MLGKYRSALLTGATGGICSAFAEILAGECDNLILLARSKSNLEDLKDRLERNFHLKVYILPIDLIEHDSINIVRSYLSDNNLSPDLLINNAGIGSYGKFDRIDLSRHIETISLNITAITELTSLFVNIMKINGGGTILNIASTFSFRPVPFWTVYSATKTFILNFTLSLAEEYRSDNIQFSVLCPSATETEFDNKAGLVRKSHKGKFNPNNLARFALGQLRKNKTLIIPGLKNKLKYFMTRLLPFSLIVKL
jgi:uncharacterized protein